MSFELTGANAPDDLPCRYGASKLMCRGPRRALDHPYVAFIGGNETYGRFVSRPFVTLAEDGLGIDCVNLGAVNAGLDAFVQDPDIIRIMQSAQLSVVQVMGAQNLSNRFYRVHPRRNDRFLAASPTLATIYRNVDFTDFHFNRHLLSALKGASPDRFSIVQDELRQAWLNRMRLLIAALQGQVLLLWLRYDQEKHDDTGMGPEPLLVDHKMLDMLRPEVIGITEIRVTPAGKTGDLADMRFGAMQAPTAEHLIGPSVHRDIAARVQSAIRPALRKKARQ